MIKTIVPSDSILHHFLSALSVTEVPVSYAIGCGLTTMGCLLRRQCYVDQVGWKVYPNQSVLLVGPSGVGKDTAINYAQKLMNQISPGMVLGGRTMPTVYKRMQMLGNPACGYIPAGEFSSFFGQQDYQSGMIQEFTDLLSTSDRKDISTKSDMGANGEWKPIYIHQPTLTMHGGTTEEWLHQAMPEGTMEGGFLGRFLILVEQFGSKHVALVKHEMGAKERKHVTDSMDKYREGIEAVLRSTGKSRELVLLEEARDCYTNWYHNRFKFFSRAVLPYANRSRDTVLRLAMLMAVSRSHWTWIDREDVQFGIDILVEVGKQLDKVILPPTPEAQAGEQILSLLPATSEEVWKVLGRKYPLMKLNAAFELLQKQGRVKKEGKVWLVSQA